MNVMGILRRSKDRSPKGGEQMRKGSFDSSHMVQTYSESPRNHNYLSHSDPTERFYADSTSRSTNKLSPYSSAPNLGISLSRRKTDGRKVVKISPQFDSDKKSPKDYVSSQPESGLWSWIAEIPQSADDPEVTDQVKAVFNFAEQFVITFFQDRPYKGDVPDEVLDRVNYSSLLSTSILQKALINADYHTTLIKHVLVTLLLELISYDTLMDQESLLPKEFQNYSTIAKARSRSDSAEGQGEIQKLQPALSAYRLLSAFLRSDVRTDENYLQERRPVIEDVGARFDQAFRYWAREDKSDVDRRTMFSRLLGKAGDLGVFLFSQPSVFIFDWAVEQQEYSHYMVPIMPRFLRLYDENGQKKEYADHMIPMQQAYIRQAGSSSSRPGTSTGTGTPSSIREELRLRDASSQQSRVPNDPQPEYHAYNPASQLPRSSESPNRRASVDMIREQGHYDQRNQSSAGRPIDTVPSDGASPRDRMGPSSFPRGPREAPVTLRPGLTSQKSDLVRRPVPPPAQPSSSEPYPQTYPAPPKTSRSYSIHELDASEPVSSRKQQAHEFHELDASTGASTPYEDSARSDRETNGPGGPQQVRFSSTANEPTIIQPPTRNPNRKNSNSQSRSASSSPSKPTNTSSRRYPPTQNFNNINAMTPTDPNASPYAPEIPARNGSMASRSGSRRESAGGGGGGGGSGHSRSRSFSESRGSESKRSMSIRNIFKS